MVTEFFDLGLVETLPELAPHGIEHHFGQRAQTFIFRDFIVLQTNTFVLIVLAGCTVDVWFRRHLPIWPPTGSCLIFNQVST